VKERKVDLVIIEAFQTDPLGSDRTRGRPGSNLRATTHVPSSTLSGRRRDDHEAEPTARRHASQEGQANRQQTCIPERADPGKLDQSLACCSSGHFVTKVQKDPFGTMCLHNSDDVIDSQHVLSRGSNTGIGGLQQTGLQDQIKSESSISKKYGGNPPLGWQRLEGRLKSLVDQVVSVPQHFDRLWKEGVVESSQQIRIRSHRIRTRVNQERFACRKVVCHKWGNWSVLDLILTLRPPAAGDLGTFLLANQACQLLTTFAIAHSAIQKFVFNNF
jgi:hypothetical protein